MCISALALRVAVAHSPQMSFTWGCWSWPLAVALTLSACSTTGGQTGEDDYAPCSTTATTLSADAVSPLGFSANDVLEYAAGQHDSTLSWHALDSSSSPCSGQTSIATVGSYSPGAGQSAVSLTLAYADGNILFTHQSLLPLASGNPYANCYDSLNIDVVATLTTSDGALDESFTTTLQASSARVADWSASLDLSKLNGSFRALPAPPRIAETLDLQGRVASWGTLGYLSGSFELPIGYGDGVPADQLLCSADVKYGDWGADATCFGLQVPLSMAIDGFSGADALALINDSPPVPMQWGGTVGNNGQANLKLNASAGQTVCAGFPIEQGGRAVLTLAGELAATTDDSLLNTDLPIQIQAFPNANGALASVTLTVSAPYDSAVPLADMYTHFGFTAPALDQYDSASCSFDSTLTPNKTGTQIQGRFEILGHPTSCTQSGATAAACPGDTLELGSWHAP